MNWLLFVAIGSEHYLSTILSIEFVKLVRRACVHRAFAIFIYFSVVFKRFCCKDSFPLPICTIPRVSFRSSRLAPLPARPKEDLLFRSTSLLVPACVGACIRPSHFFFFPILVIWPFFLLCGDCIFIVNLSHSSSR